MHSFLILMHLTPLQSLTDHIQKRSVALDRDANYTKKSRISRLPMYLFFHLKRFQWKATEGVRAKVLKVCMHYAWLTH
jgi:ubiquitin carboxyl-terminal hydrolase 14